MTKLDRISFANREEAQAENFRKMFVAMARDIRVVIIKLADRLDNMKTIGHLSEDKQREKARETLEIYAPLAHRLGISQLKWQLEDLSFATLYPLRFQEIVQMVNQRRPEREDYIKTVERDLQAQLKQAHVKAEIAGRVKHYYSIYTKMKEQGKQFDEIYDLFAVRVIVGSNEDCYTVMGIVHSLWHPVPGRIKDYIAKPTFRHLPEPAHHGHRSPGKAPGDTDTHPGDAPYGGIRYRVPLALQGGPALPGPHHARGWHGSSASWSGSATWPTHRSSWRA